MELKDFVAETLKHIIDGVKTAQDHARDVDAIAGSVSLSAREVSLIEFDVAVTTTEAGQLKGGTGIFIGPFGVGAQTQADATSGEVSRIRFSIPLHLPYQ